MAKKAIAAVMLLATAAWAEMALAPMLAMYAFHAHAGHAVAPETPSQQAAHHHEASTRSGAKHPCCPPVRRVEAEGVLVLAAENSGCQDSHRCCLRQGPQSVPAPVSEARQLGPLSSTTSTQANQVFSVSCSIEAEIETASPPYPHTFGMTLRI